jgi:ribonuclease P/MRP protein subunit POP1
MAPKRKNDEPEQPTARDKKKQKLATARTIEVQSVTTGTVQPHQNATAGPSRLVAANSEQVLS